MTSLIEGDGPLRVGHGPIRTGVTVIVPHPHIGVEPVFAGCHRLNGNGELTGLEWIRESGQLTTAETMVGRDGITAHRLEHASLVEIMSRYGRGPN